MKLSASVLRSLRSPTSTAIKVSRAFRSAGSKSAIHSYHPEEEKESDNNSQLGERASIKQEIETGVAIADAFSSTTLAYPLAALAESTTPPKEAAGVGGLELLSSMTETLVPVLPVIPWLVVVGLGFRQMNMLDSHLKSEMNATKEVLGVKIDATKKAIDTTKEVLEVKIDATKNVLTGKIDTTNGKIDAMKVVLDKLAGTTNKKNDPASHYPQDKRAV